MVKLNPYAIATKRAGKDASAGKATKKAKSVRSAASKAKGKEFFQAMSA